MEFDLHENESADETNFQKNGFAQRLVFVRRLPHLGTLSKPRRQRQRERHKTKELMSRTIAVHVRYNSWHIS